MGQRKVVAALKATMTAMTTVTATETTVTTATETTVTTVTAVTAKTLGTVTVTKTTTNTDTAGTETTATAATSFFPDFVESFFFFLVLGDKNNDNFVILEKRDTYIQSTSFIFERPHTYARGPRG